jgi:hypothetical protein
VHIGTVDQRVTLAGDRFARTSSLGIGGAHPSSLTAVSKKTAKRRAKARRKKANHRRKPNAR